jgi:hypothetical protein
MKNAPEIRMPGKRSPLRVLQRELDRLELLVSRYSDLRPNDFTRPGAVTLAYQRGDMKRRLLCASQALDRLAHAIDPARVSLSDCHPRIQAWVKSQMCSVHSGQGEKDRNGITFDQ